MYNKFTCPIDDPGLRRDFIGASDVPIIMGESPWCTPLQLYEKKLGLRENAITFAMSRGTEMEEEARQELSRITGMQMIPLRMFCDSVPCLMVNLDAVSPCGQICEIKCPMNPDYPSKVPEKYYGQLQAQMLVAQVSEMMYFSYHPLGSKLIWCTADDKYQKKMVDKVLEFHARLQQFEAPDPTDKDYDQRDDEVWNNLAEQYKYLLNASKEMNNQLEEIKIALIEQAKNRSTMGSGVKVCKMDRKGNIDYSKIIEIRDVDLEKYRKPLTSCWRITT
jgi:putative phage-type endonuclease